MPVSRFRTTMVTPGSTPPEASWTAPRILPLLICAPSNQVGSSKAAMTATRTSFVVFISRPASVPCAPASAAWPGSQTYDTDVLCLRVRHSVTNRGRSAPFASSRAVEVDKAHDLFHLRVVDAVPRVVRGVIVGMLTGVEQHHRHALDRERIVIASREPSLAVVGVGLVIEVAGRSLGSVPRSRGARSGL